MERRSCVLPLLILIGGVLNPLGLEALNQPVQRAPPKPAEPGGAAKPVYQRGTDGVVCTNEGPSREGSGQLGVAEAAERPDLGTVIGAVDRCGDVASAFLPCGLGNVVIIAVIFAGGGGLLGCGFFLFFQVLNQAELSVQRSAAGRTEYA